MNIQLATSEVPAPAPVRVARQNVGAQRNTRPQPQQRRSRFFTTHFNVSLKIQN